MKIMFLLVTVGLSVPPATRQYFKKRRVLRRLHSELVYDIGMNHWSKAHNDCLRIARVKNL